MKKPSFYCRATVSVFMLCLLAVFSGCAEIRLNTLPSPPPTAKLRVLVLPITSTLNPRGAWVPSERNFAENQYRKVARILERKGIYRVIPEEEARAATGNQSIEGWQWARGDWNLAKEAGRALHADYVLIFERKFSGTVVSKLVFLSLRTDRLFEETLVMPTMAVFRMDAMDEHREMIGAAYQKIFMAAKGDMFLTAIQKGRAIGPPTERKAPGRGTSDATKKRPHPSAGPVEKMKPPESEAPKPPAAHPSDKAPGGVTAAVEKKQPAPPAKKEQKPEPSEFKAAKPLPSVSRAAETTPPRTPASVTAPVSPPEKTPDRAMATVETKLLPPPARTEPTGGPGKDKLPAGLQTMIDKQQAGTTRKSRLVVYDFDAADQLDVVAMILTEALREELHELGKFFLVNRENIVQVMDELKLQQSGIVDEGQAVQLGKWLAANETVTGKLTLFGNLYVLQAKRTDIQSLGTLGIGSLKSPMGKEEELLNGLPSLAKKLAGVP